jgi:hypothetical protein
MWYQEVTQVESKSWDQDSTCRAVSGQGQDWRPKVRTDSWYQKLGAQGKRKHKKWRSRLIHSVKTKMWHQESTWGWSIIWGQHSKLRIKCGGQKSGPRVTPKSLAQKARQITDAKWSEGIDKDLRPKSDTKSGLRLKARVENRTQEWRPQSITKSGAQESRPRFETES